MSNPTTNYLVNNIDLSNIFQPLKYGPIVLQTTGYNVPGYGDLNKIFAGYLTGQPKANVTNFNISGYGDLNSIFAKYNPPLPIYPPFTTATSTGGTSSGIKYSYTNNYYIITFTNTNSYSQTLSNYSITFLQYIHNLNYIIVGGGGGSGSNWSQSTSINKSSGSGGGAGGCISALTKESYYVVPNTPYNITVGYGGSGGTTAGANAGSGGNSIFNSITAAGGFGSLTVNNGLSGASGTSGGQSGGRGGYYNGGDDNSSSGSSATIGYVIHPNETPTVSNTYYFSGGGAGGGNSLAATTYKYGGTGGGGGEIASYTNHNANYYLPNVGETLIANFTTKGIIGSGGGAAGIAGTTSTSYSNGNAGGSGIVILYFKYP
jgi:hypothetical protein